VFLGWTGQQYLQVAGVVVLRHSAALDRQARIQALASEIFNYTVTFVDGQIPSTAFGVCLQVVLVNAQQHSLVACRE
jgi:hypothetical protein